MPSNDDTDLLLLSLLFIRLKDAEKSQDQRKRFFHRKVPVTPVKVRLEPLIAEDQVKHTDLAPRIGHSS
jgi:hypothetical protein